MKLVLGAVLFLMCSAFVLAKSPAEWFDDLSKNERLCRRQNNLPQGNLPDLTDKSPRNLKCYVKCQFETNLKIQMSEPEKFYTNSLQAFKEMNPKADESTINKHVEILQKCKNRKGADDCDTASKISICTGEEYRVIQQQKKKSN